jgi:hypothetical protein
MEITEMEVLTQDQRDQRAMTRNEMIHDIIRPITKIAPGNRTIQCVPNNDMVLASVKVVRTQKEFRIHFIYADAKTHQRILVMPYSQKQTATAPPMVRFEHVNTHREITNCFVLEEEDFQREMTLLRRLVATVL